MMPKLRLLAPFLLALSLVALTGVHSRSVAEEIKHTRDTVKEIKNKLQKKQAILIDVREQSEWEAGHLKVARLVPLSQIRKGLDKKTLPSDKVIYCHCRSGGRVLTATKILREQGFDIRPLKLGYEALLKEGFEKAKAKPKQSDSA